MGDVKLQIHAHAMLVGLVLLVQKVHNVNVHHK